MKKRNKKKVNDTFSIKNLWYILIILVIALILVIILKPKRVILPSPEVISFVNESVYSCENYDNYTFCSYDEFTENNLIDNVKAISPKTCQKNETSYKNCETPSISLNYQGNEIILAQSTESRGTIKFATQNTEKTINFINRNTDNSLILADGDRDYIHVIEGEPVNETEYIIIGNQYIEGHIMEVKDIYNGTTSYYDDVVTFKDVFNELQYDTTITEEGKGEMIIDGNQYYVEYYADKINLESSSWYVILTWGENATYGNVGTETTKAPKIQLDNGNYIAFGSIALLEEIYNLKLPSPLDTNLPAVLITNNEDYIVIVPNDKIVNNSYLLSYELPFISKSLVPCIPNYTETNTSCKNDDTYIISFIDINNCNIPKANTTIDCDYDNNGIIGDFNDFIDRNINLDIYIGDEKADIDNNYSGVGEEKVEFIDEKNITRIKFNWEFDEKPLNMKIIEIEIQSSSSSFGYLIINGINESKTVKIDKLNSDSNAVCIKNKYIENIDDISDECDKSYEHLIECPGSKGIYDCKIENNMFVVSGITRSAVREFEIETTSIDSTSTTQTTTTTQVSTITTPTCTSNWQCAEWTPTECPKSESQTRTCIDLNNCGTATKTESRNCKYEEKTGWIFIIVIIILALSIIAVIIAIIFAAKKHKSQLPPRQPRISVMYPTNQFQQRQF